MLIIWPAPAAAAGEIVAGEDAAEAVGTSPSRPASGAINSRNDVIQAIDRICDYYAMHEPSSPVPLLLRRAQGMVAKSFYEILEDYMRFNEIW